MSSWLFEIECNQVYELRGFWVVLRLIWACSRTWWRLSRNKDRRSELDTADNSEGGTGMAEQAGSCLPLFAGESYIRTRDFLASKIRCFDWQQRTYLLSSNDEGIGRSAMMLVPSIDGALSRYRNSHRLMTWMVPICIVSIYYGWRGYFFIGW